MRRVRLTVAYDGTNYCGWQYQSTGLTIEEVLNQALSDLLREPVAVIGASRTDSGVHALCNVAVFDTENRMPADRICFALNQRLPDDIRIQRSEEAPPDWHPRKCNCVKTYEYRILNRKVPDPTRRLDTYFCYFDLDERKMAQAAVYLVGEHDFRSFASARGQSVGTVRTIYSLTVKRDARDVITIRVSGSGFLYNMVRIIAGTLLKVGMGVYPPEHVEEILYARDRHAAGQTAPACGLTLVEMEYETALRPVLLGENRDWSYRLLQTRIGESRTAWLAVERCAPDDFHGLVERVIHQAHRNGARQVYVADLEERPHELSCPGATPSHEPSCPGAAPSQEPGRLAREQTYGYYRIANQVDGGEALAPLTGEERAILAGTGREAGNWPKAAPWFQAAAKAHDCPRLFAVPWFLALDREEGISRPKRSREARRSDSKKLEKSH